jgi:GH24 family phage-related lysozyme (muramidase)
MTEPMTPPPKRTAPAKTAAGAAAIAAAVLAVAPFVASKEGERHVPYYDGGRVKTVCMGETQNVEDRIYSHDECAAMERKRLAKDYAPAVLNCVPAFVEDRRRKPFMAAIDASYNAGPVGFCKSPMARYFNAGQWAKGCDAFVGWRATIQGVPSRGLRNRREGERLLCMRKV